MEAALLDVRSVPRHFDLLRRLKGVAQQVAARQNGLPKRARKVWVPLVAPSLGAHA